MTIDQFEEWKWRQRNAVIAQSIRDALLFVLILHAVVTVLAAPRRKR